MSAAVWNAWLPLGIVGVIGLLILVLPAVVIGGVNRREHRSLVAFARQISEKNEAQDKAA